jgi:hypothetical protein
MTTLTNKTAKFLGKVTAKTISATGVITEKTVDTIKVTPSKTTNVTKSLVSSIAEGYREVRPTAEVEVITPKVTTSKKTTSEA